MKKESKTPTWETFKGMAHDGGGHWMTQLYHYIGALFAFGASKVGLNPNQLTYLSGITVFLSMVIMFNKVGQGVLWAAVVTLLSVVSYALDCADGQLARATNTCSKYGAWLDHVLDSSKTFIVNFTVGWMMINNEGLFKMSMGWVFIAMAVNITGSALYFFAWNYKVMIAGEGLISRLSNEATSNRVRIMKFYHQFTDYGWFPLIFIFLAYPVKFAVVYLVYGCGTFLVFICYILISARYMKKL